MVGNISFRGAALGGFNRDDVMNYIEESAKKHADTVRDLRNHLEETQSELERFEEKCQELELLNEELKNQLSSQQEQVRQQLIPLQEEARRITEERARYKQSSERLTDDKQLMSERIEYLEKTNAALQAQTTQIRDVLSRRTDEVKSLNATIQEKDTALDELRQQVADMQDDHRTYLTICGRLGRIETEMQSRSAILENEAQEKAQSIIDEANAYHDRIFGSVHQEADTFRQEIQEQLTSVRTNAISTSEEVSHSVSAALGEVAHIQSLLEHLTASLNEQVNALRLADLSLSDSKEEEAKV